jgi:hypothetical protein
MIFESNVHSQVLFHLATRERGTEAELTQVAPYWFWLQQRNQKPSQFFFVHDSNFRFDFINKNDFSRFLADF